MANRAASPTGPTGPVHDPGVVRLREAVAAWQAAQPRTQSRRGTVRLVAVEQWPEAIADLSRDDVDALCALLTAGTTGAPPAATGHWSGATPRSVTSLLWGLARRRFEPDEYDVVGAAVCLVGVAVIIPAPWSGALDARPSGSCR